MDQAFKESEQYRKKATTLSKISRIAFIASLVVSALAVFMPYLFVAFTFVVPLGILVILLTETPAVVYRFKARKIIKAVLDVPDPNMDKERIQDIATIIVLVPLAAVAAYVLVMYVYVIFKIFS